MAPGLAAVKLNVEPGYPFLHRIRTYAPQPIADLFATIAKEVAELEKFQPNIKQHPGLLKGHLPFLGELLLGHLRYGTQGRTMQISAILLFDAMWCLRATLLLQETSTWLIR